MTERNVLTGTAATILSPFVDGWQNLLIWIVVSLVLVIGDLRFGICASRKRGEKIRGSRAIRRTINKMVDYICWVSIAWVLGGSFGKLFGVPLLAAIIMMVVCTIELTSIFDNYFEYKGVKKKLNIWKMFCKLFKIPDFADIMIDLAEEAEQKEEQENGQNNFVG